MKAHALVTSGLALAGLILVTTTAASQQKTLKEQLVGAWVAVSNDNVGADGARRQPFGASPNGTLFLDASGRYALILARPDRPKFKANNRLQGTADEIKAAWDGVTAHFGTWSVNEGERVITLQMQGATFPNLEGRESKRPILSLTADELKWANPEAGSGGKSETLYRRAR